MVPLFPDLLTCRARLRPVLTTIVASALHPNLQLRKRCMPLVLEHADELVRRACEAEKVRLAVMVLEDVQAHPGGHL